MEDMKLDKINESMLNNYSKKYYRSKIAAVYNITSRKDSYK